MVMRGQAILPLLGKLNEKLGMHNIASLANSGVADSFAPGRSLGSGLSRLIDANDAVVDALEAYIAMLPGSIQETERAVIHYALTSKPPVGISFVWEPGYDYEIKVWEVVEPKPRQSQITILLRSRYPDDDHPRPRG